MKNLNLFLTGLLIASVSIFTACSSEEGCTNSDAINYNADADEDDGSCIVPKGCTDPEALNYDAEAKENNGTCIYSNISSETIIVRENDWVDRGANGFEAEKNVPALTGEILQTGLVACYIIDDEVHEALPLSIYFSDFGGFNRHLSYTMEPGKIIFIVQDDDGLTGRPERLEYRLVILSDASAAAELNIDIENYEEVSSSLNLE